MKNDLYSAWPWCDVDSTNNNPIKKLIQLKYKWLQNKIGWVEMLEQITK